MTFWLSVALLIAATILILAPALLRKHRPMPMLRNQQNVVIALEQLAELETDLKNGVISQQEFEQSKLDLERGLLADLREDGGDQAAEQVASRKPGVIALALLAVLIPLALLGVYGRLGAPELVGLNGQTLAQHQQSKGMPSVDQMIGGLLDKLKQNPEDAEGWYLLGRTYMAVQDYPKASGAFKRLNQLVPDQPQIMLAYADALAMVNRGDMTGESARLVRRAVELAPENTTALWLAGMLERQEGKPREALKLWARLMPLLKEPDTRQRLQGMVDELVAEAGIPQAEVAGLLKQPVGAEAATPARILVEVSLDSALVSEATPDDLVFVYAKALQGPPMPLAAKRLKVSDLPVQVVLDDSSAMLPQMKLSKFPQVTVGARVSRSGDPVAQSGDLSGEVSPVAVTADGKVQVVIANRVP